MQLVDQCLGLVSGITDDKIDRLESALLHMPQSDIKTIHSFLPGIYERTIIVPPWTVLTGARHKTDYRVRLDKGRIAVSTDDGIKEMCAFLEFPAKAGIRRVGRVFEDEVIWTDIYDNPDDCKDIEELERRLYEDHPFGMMTNRTTEMLSDLRVKNQEALCLA